MSQEKIRCFIAVKVPQNILSEIEKYLVQLRKISSHVRWVKASGIHITLKFLGEIEPLLVDQVKESLQSVAGIVKPFEVMVHGSGCFPNPKKPRVFWLGLEQSIGKELNVIYDWINEKLATFGFEKEKRRFSPHLTLGRVRTPADFTSLLNYMQNYPFPKRGFKVHEIVLMRSILKPSGAEYIPITTYNL
jgi:2'-5' RNA ligase